MTKWLKLLKKKGNVTSVLLSFICFINYDQALKLQDEVLLTRLMPMTTVTLQFWSKGSIYYCRDTYDNCDLEVWIVVGSWDGDSNDDIYVCKADDDWLAEYEWALTSTELTRLLPGKLVRIGFRYKGLNGAQISLEDVQICSDRANMAMPWLIQLLGDEN